jgi:hypothetical protein
MRCGQQHLIVNFVHKQQTMPISICFHDFIMPLTPAMHKHMLEHAFAVDYKTVPDAEAVAILFNINLIQENLIGRSLNISELWHQCKSDHHPQCEEAFPWFAPGTTMLLSMIWVKKAVFAKLHPDHEYRASILDAAAILDSIINLTNLV